MTSVEKVVAEVDVVDEVDEVAFHVMREVVIEDKIIMKMAEDSRQERMVSYVCFLLNIVWLSIK
jgi:hypothetical protein